MELEILDTEFRRVAVVDSYKSMIWTDRYCDYGDFELYIPLPTVLINDLVPDNYLYLEQSEHLMIIETAKIETDIEDGDYLVVTGRSLETILMRRVIRGQVTYQEKTTKEIIVDLLNSNFIEPSDPKRKISNFVLQDFDIPAANEVVDDTQYTGDEIYDVIQSLCDNKKLGFKITLSPEFNFIFTVYQGENRTYDQTENPYVIFSPNFENIIDSRYTKSTENYHNAILVAGEGQGSDQKFAEVGETEGLYRRELYYIANEVSSKTDGGTLSNEEYMKLLEKKGQDQLKENDILEEFDGKTEAIEGFTYGTDFFLGDLVQVENQYDKQGIARVTEIIFSQDVTGIEMYPTFKVEEPEEEEEET